MNTKIISGKFRVFVLTSYGLFHFVQIFYLSIFFVDEIEGQVFCSDVVALLSDLVEAAFK